MNKFFLFGIITGLVLAIVLFLAGQQITDEPNGLTATEGYYTFEDLLDAIEWVESRGDPWAVGDNGEAVGAYQMHTIYVDDVNRILKLNGSTAIMRYMDRYDKGISRAAVAVWLDHYGGSFEEMARKHKGGPTGHKKESTKPYWEKVKARMDSQK